jgi:hypothetical protein
VTGLRIFEIVRRIQCEASDTVRDLHPARGNPGRMQTLRLVNEDIKKKRNTLKTKLDLIKATSDYGTSQLELEEAFDVVNLQIDQVLQKIGKLEAEAGGPGQETRDNLLKTLRQEARQLDRQHGRLVAIGRLFTEATNANKELETALENRKPLEDITDFEGNNAVFQFVFQVTENNDASSNGTITWPITPGVITLGYSVGDKKRRASDRQVKLVSSFAELNRMPCSEVEVPEERHFPLRYPITGDIGLNEVISDYMTVSRMVKGRQKFQTSGDSYRDKITFTTTINAGLTPGVNLNRRMGQLIEARADLAVNRTDIHELTMFLTPPGELPTGGTQELVIRQMPPVRVRGRLVEQSPAGL